MTKMMLLSLTLATTFALAPRPRAAEPMKKGAPAAKPAVTDICFFPQSSVLRVELANGRTYHYADVPEALADQFAVSERKREFYDREISRQYRTAPASNTEKPAPAAARSATAKASAKVPSESAGKPAAIPAAAKEAGGAVPAAASTSPGKPKAKPKTKSSSTKSPAPSTQPVPSSPAKAKTGS